MIETINKAIHYINENIKSDIRLDDICEHVNYSLSHLHSIFFKVTGQSLANYIRKRKMQHAAYSLVFENKPILDIAIDVGYSSHEAFTRAFKQEYGNSPKYFRDNPINRELFRRLGLARSQKALKDKQIQSKKGHTITMKSSNKMVNLDNVRQVTFYNGSGWAPEDIPFPSCMSSVMEYLGENFPIKELGAHNQRWQQHMGNVYFLGWSGMAFGLLWKEGWHLDIADLMMVDDPQQLIKRTFDAVGRDYHMVGKTDDDSISFKQEIVQSIDKGIPVLAFGVIGPPECCIITGYADGGNTVMGWNFFQQDEEFDREGVIILPSGQFMRTGWDKHTYSMIIIGDKIDKPEINNLDKESLQNAVRIAKTENVNGFISGHSAYDAWKNQILCDEGITQVMADTLKSHHSVHNVIVGNVAEARCWAARYLWDMMGERYENTDIGSELDKAAQQYDNIHTLMWDAWNVLGGNGNPDAYIKFADRENREKLAIIIDKAKECDIRAIGHIDATLELMEKQKL